MKTFCAAAAIGLGLLAAAGGAATAQPYGGYDRGYDRGYREDRGYDRGYREDRGYRDRGGYDDRGPRGGGRGYGGWDEVSYLNCNPDVRRAVRAGQMESGFAHYQRHGRREGRRLSC